jgi:nitric oxide reductase activation protein
MAELIEEMNRTEIQEVTGSTKMPDRDENLQIDDVEGLNTLQEILETLKREIAEERMDEQLNQEAFDEVTQNRFKDDWGIPHTSLELRSSYPTITRDDEKEMLDYTEKMGHQLARKAKKQLEVSMNNGNRCGYTGRLGKRRLYRQDQKIFVKKQEPKKELDLAMMILIDRSGSTTAYISGTNTPLEDVLSINAASIHAMSEELKIPCMVMGYKSPEDINIGEVYGAFNHTSRLARKNILRTFGDDCNRDGVFFNAATQLLKKRSEKIKLMIILSDGQPAGYNYCGEKANEHTRQAIRNAERAGITPVIAGVGDCADALYNLYGGKNFLDISNVDTLGIKLERVLKTAISKASR